VTDDDSRDTLAATAGRVGGVANIPTLATDLDGTLIPLEEDAQGSQYQALREIADRADRGALELIFVTGRHRESVQRVSQARQLPRPRWLICDVGTTLLYDRAAEDSRTADSSGAAAVAADYQPVLAYDQFLAEQCQQVLAAEVGQRLPPWAGLMLQEPEKQGRYKLSFYCDAPRLEEHRDGLATWLREQALAYQVVSSVDPFNQDGLIDLLPQGVDKAAALQWWLQFTGRPVHCVVYAGDSGNDLAALTGQFRAIVVGNAAPGLVRQVQEFHAERGTLSQLYVAQAAATAGVLEGCRWFQVL